MIPARIARTASIGAAVIFFAAALAEAARIVLDRPWPGLSPMHSEIAGLVLVLLWISAGVICLFRQPGRAPIVVVATFLFLPHFVIARAAGSPSAIAFALVLPVLAVLVLLTFRPQVHVEAAPTPATLPPADRGVVDREVL